MFVDKPQVSEEYYLLEALAILGHCMTMEGIALLQWSATKRHLK